MKIRFLLALCFLASPLIGQEPNVAQEISGPQGGIDLLQYSLLDLNNGERVELEQYRDQPILIMLFQPECPYCGRQVAAIQEIKEECPAITPIAVGVNGSRQRLRQELVELDPDFTAYEASGDMNRDLGDIDGTPVMLLTDQEGLYQTHLFGYQNLDVLRQVMQERAICI